MDVRTTQLTQDERIQIIQENFGKPYRDLAKLTGVSYQTVCNDMRHWRKTGGFLDFVYERFGVMTAEVESLEPGTAYKVYARLIEKDLGDKLQVDATVEIGEKLNKILGDAFGVKREDDADEP